MGCGFSQRGSFRQAIGVLVVVVLAAVIATPAAASAPVAFTHGVASGDVTPVSAVLWTRVDQEARLMVEVSLNPEFQGPVVKRSVLATAEDDFAAKALVAPLKPDQDYFYRWSHPSAVSEVGTFRTPPLPFFPADVRFVYTGDSDGTKVSGVPFFNNFEVLEAARAEEPDFFVYLGDTIYSDSVLRASPATTLTEYRDAYKENRDYANLRNLLKATSTYAIWDDHEVENDFDSETVDPAQFAAGREAFLEYMPIEEIFFLQDPDCADDPLFRVFRWGKDVDLIILDERSCRSAEAVAACSFALGVFDLVPTLPSSLRVAFGQPPSPPAGCLDAIFDPARTFLGAVQKATFFSILEHSTAKFKFVINEDPIQQYWVVPYDRWEGYGAERAEVLNFIRDRQIENVVFLTTDTHATLLNEVFIDLFTDPQPIAFEAVTGPIATFTFQEEIILFAGPAAVTAVQALLSLAGADCRHLDADSYGLVEVDAGTGTVTIASKDAFGAVVHDQLNPEIACSATIGP